MKILVTGANGFIGKNLTLELKNEGFEILSYDLDKSEEQLNEYLKLADFIIHLAGVNRPLNKEEFYDGNTNFTLKLINLIKQTNRKIPIIFSSSIQASLENDYGVSKKKAEELLLAFAKENNNPVYIYQLSNVFGKWSRPNYNSVVATFCYNITHNLPIQIHNQNATVSLVYIDDIVKEFISIIKLSEYKVNNDILEVLPVYHLPLTKLADTLYDFKKTRENFLTPHFESDFEHKLYATFLSYYEVEDFVYNLKMNVDQRGSFTEVLKTLKDGQFSVNVSKPDIVKGNHYHHTKTEKFIVVSGICEIKFRKINETTIKTFVVNGDKLQVIDIPPGYTHSIKNIGKIDSVTLIWASEIFDKNNPDTYYEEVEINEK
ncbi:MAG: SDR family oxidoreductase [Erysipelotrichia bacterium]|jgi:UDP-2-acetamido-2,6-beta-L-arabino-hexul-4-ose reductase|nr:SDR family oxidoreductase [Erysipelotrichia bacterium]